MKLLLVFLFSFSFLYGCKMEESHSISILSDNCDTLNFVNYLDNKMLDMSDLAYDVRIVKLSTTEESLVGNIMSIVFNHEFIYINDDCNNGNVIIFDNEGAFVKRLKKGNGPGEISYVEDIFWNDSDSCLYVYQAHKIAKFSSCGDFIEDYILPYYLADIMPKSNGGYLGVVKEVQNNLNKYMFIGIDTSFQITNYYVVDEHFKPLMLIDHYIRKSVCNDLELIVTRPYDNRIFSYSGDTVQVKYYLDLGNKELDLSPLTSPLDYETLRRIQEGAEKYSYIGKYYEIDNYIYFCLQKGNMYCVDLYYNKTTGRIRSGYAHKVGIPNSGSLNGNRDGYFAKVLLPENFVGDSIFLNSVKESNILVPNDVKLIVDTKSDDNPLLVFFKLRDIPNDTK